MATAAKRYKELKARVEAEAKLAKASARKAKCGRSGGLCDRDVTSDTERASPRGVNGRWLQPDAHSSQEADQLVRGELIDLARHQLAQPRLRNVELLANLRLTHLLVTEVIAQHQHQVGAELHVGRFLGITGDRFEDIPVLELHGGRGYTVFRVMAAVDGSVNSYEVPPLLQPGFI
jgi:hypothetical protein